MCSPRLEMKLEKAIAAMSDDKSEQPQEQRRRPLMVNHVTGYNQGISDAVINRANDLYVAK